MPKGKICPRALIVEDEALVAFFLEDLLLEVGCRVEGVASQLQEGLTLARSADFDVAFLDVNLGHGQHSFAIAELLMRRQIPFAFVTGYTPSSLEGRFPDVPVLQKPYRKEDIETFLEHVYH